MPSDKHSVSTAGAAVGLLSNFTCVTELQLDALRQTPNLLFHTPISLSRYMVILHAVTGAALNALCAEIGNIGNSDDQLQVARIPAQSPCC